MDRDNRIAAASSERAAFHASLGALWDPVFAPLISGRLLGGPSWPSREAWRMLRRPGRTALVSDGLSDPFEDRAGAGLGREILMEVEGDLDDVGDSWLFTAVQQLSNVAAGHGSLADLVDQVGTVSVEVEGDAFPDRYRTGSGRVGVLIQLGAGDLPASFQLPEDRVRLLVATVLSPEQNERILGRGDSERAAIAAELADHLSRIDVPTAPEPAGQDQVEIQNFRSTLGQSESFANLGVAGIAAGAGSQALWMLGQLEARGVDPQLSQEEQALVQQLRDQGLKPRLPPELATLLGSTSE